MRLALENLEARAGGFHLGPISLAVGDGEYLIVLGPTGAGKTVTLETVAGLRPASGGRILMDGRDITRMAPEARRIGFLYQDSLLFPHLCVRDNVAYGAHRLARPERAAMIARLARLLEIEPLLERMPRGLSGGERQRAALARALAANPAILLLDEPMAALDPNSRQALRQTLLRLHRELGTATIHVTHNFAEALALGDRVAIMIQGKLLQAGAPRDVFTRPETAAVAGFLKSARLAPHEPAADNNFAAMICPRRLALRLSADADDSVAPLLEADGAELRDAPPPEERAQAMAGRIVAVARDGLTLRLSVNVGVELRVSVSTAGNAVDTLAEGRTVLVQLPKTPA